MEVTIEITGKCPHNCDYCSSNSSQDSESCLTILQIEKFLKSFVFLDRINISGGEPLSHPDFYRILKLCESMSPDVRVYTNAFKHIVFNAHIISEVKTTANVCVIPGKSLTIPKANHVNFLKLIPQGRAKNMNPTSISSSQSNCSNCIHKLLQSDGKITKPCKKEYKG